MIEIKDDIIHINKASYMPEINEITLVTRIRKNDRVFRQLHLMREVSIELHHL